MEKNDTKIPFGKMIKYISERNIEELEKMCDKYKVLRYSYQAYLENFDIEKTDSDNLINIGYNRALIDIMQAFIEEMRTQNAIKSISVEQKDAILSALLKQSCLSGLTLSSMIGVNVTELENIVNKINGNGVRLINVEELEANILYSLAPKGYKYITSK